MRRSERGAALIETALALPVILAALYGLTWGIREGVVSERLESAVRYAGVISAQQNPYHDYSLYTLYNNLGTTDNVLTARCTPPTNLFLNGGTMPVVVPGTQQKQRVMPTFWEPDANSVVPFCDNTSVRQYFSGVTQSYLFLQSAPGMQAIVSDGGFLGRVILGSALESKYRFYRSPDLATLMHCSNTLNSAISASLAPIKYGSSVPVVAPLQLSAFNSLPIALSSNCTSGVGAQTIPPTPAPQTFVPAVNPSGTPSVGQSATPTPSPNPTRSPATPTPSASPSPSPSKSASPSASPSTQPGTPSPTVAPSTPKPTQTPTAPPPTAGPGTPRPTMAPTAQPSATAQPTTRPASPSPTVAPSTPHPTVAPSTPHPTTPPTMTPTQKPAPTPAPSIPPGAIS